MEKKNKKNKKQRKLLLAILMLLLTGGMLASTSYAWFTANKIVTVSTLNVNVAATNGLQISTDGLDWKAVITNEDILKTIGDDSTYTGNVNQLPITGTSLAPVSSVGNVDSTGKMEMYHGSLDPDETTGSYMLTATKSTETKGTNGHFVAFDLFFQVQERTQLYLTENTKVTAEATADTGIQNAARVAFINEGNIASGSAPTAIQGLTDASATPFIWEPNFDVHTPTGVANALNAYGITTSTTGAAALDYVGVKAPISTPVAVNDKTDTLFGAVTPSLRTPVAGIADTTYEKLLILEPGITKVRIYMWIEGQDVDCENMASGGEINFDLQFSSNKDKAGNPGEIEEP